MKILLADDHGLYRDSMRVWLKQLDKTVEICMASSFHDVEDSLQSGIHFDLLLLDLGMPDMQGAISVATLCQLAGTTPVIVVSADENPMAIRSCLDSGAAGYVPKSANGETILQSIHHVLGGGIYLPAGVKLTSTDNAPRFTSKQLQILALLAEGASNKKIAAHLFLTEGTVKQYVSAILKKLDLDNRTQAGIMAREILGIGQS